MKSYRLYWIVWWIICSGFIGFKSLAINISDYDVVWNTPSKDVSGSMPVGGGNLQLNTWCEDNDILFYLGSTDCYLDNSFTLGKLGRIRLHFTPNPFTHTFKQDLRLQDSEVIYTGDNGFKFVLYTDVNSPVVYFDMESEVDLKVKLSYETWNFNVEYEGDKILFYHTNSKDNALLDKAVKEQKVEDLRSLIPDPITGLISGGLVSVPGLKTGVTEKGIYCATGYESHSLVSERPMKQMQGQIPIRMEQDPSLSKWKENLFDLDLSAEINRDYSIKIRKKWWREFWDRSYIYIQPELEDTVGCQKADLEAWKVGRNYQLFRYMLGCSSKGRLPILFNGGIFNFDSPDAAPERRNWEGCEFMAQNQRLVYWPMLKTGDFDLMIPALNMYRNMLPFQQAKAKMFWGIEGAAYPEALMVYGLHAVYNNPEIMTDCFGRCPDRKRTEYGHSGLIHLEYHYTSMLDFAYMALNYVKYNQCDVDLFLSFIENAVKFFDNYYQKKTRERMGVPLVDGKLVLYPASALELYAGAKNPTDVVSGLHVITNAVLKLDIPDSSRVYFESLKNRLPNLPVVQKDGHKVLAPAESWELEGNQSNMEFPQLYSVFPFDYYTLESSDLDVVKDTWMYNSKDAAQKNYICWFQGGIYTARMGLTEEAKSYAIRKFLHPFADGCDKKVKPNRFPAFWSNPGFCHTPDIDHGGAAMVGLQDMLMQVINDSVYITPAWPKDWNCQFKLRGPDKMVIKGEVKDGKVLHLEVYPAVMRNRVIVKE